MIYKSLEECLLDLEKNGHLLRIKEEVDPNLEMAAIHLRVHEKKGPALLFENVKGCKFRCVSNIYGTTERSKFLFKETTDKVKQLIELKNDPAKILKNPFKFLGAGLSARKSFPKEVSFPSDFNEIKISDLPLIKHWPMDGGAFVTLPQVYSEDADAPGVMNSNLGMYRIQLNGNDYVLDKEIGLHYQLHRGIGVHQTKAAAKNQKLKVSIFIGGPPAHSFSAVMPLPEGISELTFAGVLGGRRFRYVYHEGFCISADADFVITGEVETGENKMEGPFGDHLGYYSLKHPFPLMRVHKVYAKKNAIWPFTVVGRPPQEDTAFGNMIHEMAGDAIGKEIPGVKEVHAVDAAGVHPLLLAVGSERYTPFLKEKFPSEILTQANHILGSGQLSLAKFLFIAAADKLKLDSHKEKEFFTYIFERINFERDIHFYTNTSIDTLDYSGTGINTGSKVVFAAFGEKIRELKNEIHKGWNELDNFKNPDLVFPGVLALRAEKFSSYEKAETEIKQLSEKLKNNKEITNGIALIIVCDEPHFVAATLNNFLWVTFTRSNPSHDIYGVDDFTLHKHWGCRGPVIIDARIKPHHAPPLVKDAEVEKRIDRLFAQGGSLAGV
ncbi:MAG: UbiD family decarboxylase [Bacteroidia bacterium]|nr:UbiD family decarboxylase [Bacteroidia bacterium]